ncbi:Predicted alpha/beta hydrolase [Roseateles sp. YR242]|uniref:alpha/beta hydrolase family protein n=1 Tax=Roseateles sp. YR242 TaxID=1855305 RepID=UPI0008C73AE9|nr:alpha/beta fold hydrolase [Roseateles sp. YR242]SEL52652.1 Predicted alpha/beta hydrolase [Roseateles sp. YR242]
MSDPLALTLTAADGYRLSAKCFPAQGAARGRLIVAGATAVPQGFYRRFAAFAAARGYETLTFDYRGLGGSRPAHLKGFRMDLLDWGRLDLAAAVAHMAQPDLPLYIVGHSYGGHALGVLPNHDKVAGVYVFGTGAGWHGYMPLLERLRVQLMWNLVLPVLTWWKGYCPWSMLGLGEDLPIDVYRQWRHWCQFPRYFFDDPAMQGIEHEFAAIRTPIVAVNALDDLWARPQSRDAFVAAYRNAPLIRTDLDPHTVGGKVGHMGYFRSGAEPLWQNALNFFAGLPATPR